MTVDLNRVGDTRRVTLPIGLFGRERPPSQVTDGAGEIVRHLPIDDANERFRREISRRLLEVVSPDTDIDTPLDEIQRHRADGCARLGNERGDFDGYALLAAERWGCPAVGDLLRELAAANGPRPLVADVVRLLFDWQNCDPLLVEVSRDRASHATLTIAFDEELGPWFSPWDRRRLALGRLDCDAPLDDRPYAALVSRGGPFQQDLNQLVPRRPLLWPSRSRSAWLRVRGQWDVRHLMWHVAWEQWAVAAVERHIEVIVPPELVVVRLRSARPDRPTPEFASQVGLRAHITLLPENRASPELMSVVLCHHGREGWIAGGLIAVLTGILLVPAVWLEFGRLDKQVDAAATVILLGPAFTTGLLSTRATSEIADALLVGLRRLLAFSAVCIALCAAVLVAVPTPMAPIAVSVLGGLLIMVGAVLLDGARRSRSLQRESQERERRQEFRSGQPKLAACDGRQRTPRPDRFIVSGEGERMPWGWLEVPGGRAVDLEPPPLGRHPEREEDKLYWSSVVGPPPNPVAIPNLIAFARAAANSRDETRAL